MGAIFEHAFEKAVIFAFHKLVKKLAVAELAIFSKIMGIQRHR